MDVSSEANARDQLIPLSIIIVNFNTRRLLQNCLRSVYETAGDLHFEVFVVDNASSDGSSKMIKTHFPQVRLIENHQDSGFVKAANLALLQARGRYSLVSHPDIEFTPGSIQNMLNFLRAHDEVGVVGANCLYPDGSCVESAIKPLSVTREIVEFWSDSLNRIRHKLHRLSGLLDKLRSRYYWDHQNLSESNVVYFSCMMFHTELLETIGYFDEKFFIWFADYDWCHRVISSGRKVCLLPEAKVIHYEHYGLDSTDDKSVRYKADWFFVHHLLSADRFALIKKYHSRWLLWTATIFAKLSLWRTRLRRFLFRLRIFNSLKEILSIHLKKRSGSRRNHRLYR